MGIVAGGSSVGGVCFPIMLSHVMPRIGFAWTLRLVALITLLCYCIAAAISTAKLPRKPLKSPRQILDFGGFRDIRYSTLAVANVVGNFGLYVPYYYIGMYFRLAYITTLRINIVFSTLRRCAILDHPIERLLPPNDQWIQFLRTHNVSQRTSFIPIVLADLLTSGGLVADHVGGLNLLYPVTIICGCLCLLMWLLAGHIGVVVCFTCLYGKIVLYSACKGEMLTHN